EPAESCWRSKHLADHEADNASTYREPNTGHDERNDSGRDDIAGNLKLRCLHRAGWLQQLMTNGGHASVGVLYDRKDRQKQNDRNLGSDVKSEPKGKQGQQRHGRRGVKSIDIRRECPIEPNITPHKKSKRNSKKNRNSKAGKQYRQRPKWGRNRL